MIELVNDFAGWDFLVFVLTFVWFRLGIAGRLQRWYPLNFDGMRFFYFLIIGTGTSQHGSYEIFCTIIPVGGFSIFWRTLHQYKGLKYAWLCSVVSGISFILSTIIIKVFA